MPASCRISCPKRRACAPPNGPSRRSRPTCTDRRVEITGPVERKMVINALNSGANVFMADFEDSNSPTWAEQYRGPDQPARRDPPGPSTYTSPEGKEYALAPKTAVLLVRPRGWHLVEKHCLGGRPAGIGLALRFRPVLLPQRQGADRERHRPVFLSAEDGEPPGSAPLERRLRVRPGLPRRSAGHHPRDGADRDHSRRVRDGRDPLRAARPFGRARTAGAGTTFSASSRSSAIIPSSCCRTARRSRWTAIS